MTSEEEIVRLRAALVAIRGWRERDRNSMVDVIRFIEDTANEALNRKPRCPECGGSGEVSASPHAVDIEDMLPNVPCPICKGYVRKRVDNAEK